MGVEWVKDDSGCVVALGRASDPDLLAEGVWLAARDEELRRRVEGLRHPADRRSRLVAGAVAARAVARLSSVPLEAVQLTRPAGAAPVVAVVGHPGDAPRVSLSHAGEWCAAAASHHHVGIDIERAARPTTRDLQAWTHGEARFKARSTGAGEHELTEHAIDLRAHGLVCALARSGGAR